MLLKSQQEGEHKSYVCMVLSQEVQIYLLKRLKLFQLGSTVCLWKGLGWRTTALSLQPFHSIRDVQNYSFKLDMFHLLKVGLSRDVTGSLIIILCRLGFFDMADCDGRDLPSRLERAHGNFKLFCLEHKKVPWPPEFQSLFFSTTKRPPARHGRIPRGAIQLC